MQCDRKKGQTYPYCPSVWAMPSDDAPFIIKGCAELPSGRGKLIGMKLRDLNAHMKIPATTCQSLTSATAKYDFNGLSRSWSNIKGCTHMNRFR